MIVCHPHAQVPQMHLNHETLIQSFQTSETGSQSWIYIGSHNATQSAWGNVSYSRATGDLQLSMNNWELGLVACLADAQGESESQPQGLEIPIPFQFPPPKYGSGDVPWVCLFNLKFIKDSLSTAIRNKYTMLKFGLCKLQLSIK